VIAQHGIDIVAAAWTGQPYEEGNLLTHVIPALAPRGLHYVLLYDFKIAYGDIGLDFDRPPVRTRFIQNITRFATDPAFFHNSSYLKLDNQPVIYLYVTREPDLKGTVKPECGNKNCIEFAFDQARAAVQAAGFPDLYIVADHIWWTDPDYDKLQLMGAKAATALVPVPDNRGIPQTTAQRPVRLWADDMSGLYSDTRTDLARRGTIDLMPGVFVQFNNTGFGVEEVCHLGGPDASKTYNLLDGTDWRHMLTKAGMEQRWVATKTSILPNCTEVETSNTDTSIVWIYSFNEWGEGSGLEPLESRSPPYPYGFGSDPLQIAQSVLGTTGATSLPPEPVQRFPEGTVEGLRPPFSWDEVQFGEQYNIRIKDSADQLIVDEYMNDPDYRPASDMIAGQPYTWKVRGRNNVGWGAFSANAEFTPTPQCLAAPLTPQPIAPVGCVGSLRPTFSWSASTCAAEYQVDVARVSPEEHLPYCTTQQTSCVLDSDLLPGVEYRWKVKANNSIGSSNWTQLTYFTPICGPAASIGDATVTEVNTGTAEALVSVSLSAPASSTVTVSYATANGSAAAGADYEPSSGTLTFEPGATTKAIAVRAVGDVLDEPTEDFLVNLSGAVGAYVADGQGHISIMDDDSPWKVAAVADYDGDGWSDLLWQHQAEGWLVVWLMDGTVRRTAVLPEPNRAANDFANWKVVASPDLNGDGDADLLWQHQPTGTLVVWLMNGTTRVAAESPQPNAPASDGANWRVAGVADLNGDSHPDLLWQHRATGSLVVWYMNGLVKVSSAQPSPSAPASDVANWEVVGVDDFNNDSAPDFLWQNRLFGYLVVWHMNGVTRTSVSTPTPSVAASEPGNWRIAGVADFDGYVRYVGGTPDLLWQHRGPGWLVVWLMNGVVRSSVAIPVPNGPAE
jgi:hypothetical protein